ncbi:MAG: hypothetical protein P1U34_08860 [Coxiellaceae bacterium]|nr:hypothetical protein [Coxiellaceae bacterium]
MKSIIVSAVALLAVSNIAMAGHPFLPNGKFINNSNTNLHIMQPRQYYSIQNLWRDLIPAYTTIPMEIYVTNSRKPIPENAITTFQLVPTNSHDPACVYTVYSRGSMITSNNTEVCQYRRNGNEGFVFIYNYKG